MHEIETLKESRQHRITSKLEAIALEHMADAKRCNRIEIKKALEIEIWNVLQKEQINSNTANTKEVEKDTENVLHDEQKIVRKSKKFAIRKEIKLESTSIRGMLEKMAIV